MNFNKRFCAGLAILAMGPGQVWKKERLRFGDEGFCSFGMHVVCGKNRIRDGVFDLGRQLVVVGLNSLELKTCERGLQNPKG